MLAYFTDVHVDPQNPTKVARARAAVEALVELDPDAILHGGDLTEYGSVREHQTWVDLLPAALRSRVHHVPGNHESRWDASAYENYEQFHGARNHSFDVGGLHVVMTDPTMAQQELAHYDRSDLAWLRRDLARAGSKPKLVVGHYPVGDSYYLVNNAEDFLDVLSDAGVAGFLCGHTHREHVSEVNGLTQIVGAANANEPGFYTLTRRRSAHADTLTVERVVVADPAKPGSTGSRRELTTIDLAPRRHGNTALRPLAVSATVSGNQVQVRARLSRHAPAARVDAAIYNYKKVGGSYDDPWQQLTASGTRWEGSLTLANVVPGEHRVIVRVVGADGTVWRELVPFEVAGFRPLWTADLGGVVQAGLVEFDGLVVAASSAGAIRGLRPRGSRATTVWSRTIGPVHTNLALSRELGRVFAPSSDHHVYGLSAATGKVAWKTDLGDPVMSDLTVAEVAGKPVVLAAARRTFACIDAASGAVLWRHTLPQITCGAAACDGERVYLGDGDGNAWALDARTGAPVWTTDQTPTGGTYSRLIYGPWDSQVMLPDDLVLVSTVLQTRALHRVTGGTAWEIKGSYRHTAPVWSGEYLLYPEENGTVRLVDPADGSVHGQTSTVPQLANAGVVLTGTDAVVTGHGGLVYSVDTATMTSRVRGQISRDYVFSTPVAADRGKVYVVGTMGGELRGYAYPATR